MRVGIALVLGLAAVTACRGKPDVLTARLIDPTDIPAWPQGPLSRIEVRGIRPVPGAPPEGLRRRLDVIDTIPGVRTPGPPMTVGDAVVLGFEVGADGKVGMFRYDTRLAAVTRSPLPTWLSDVTFVPPPAFSPEARYLAYLGAIDDGTVRLVVRAWPGGTLRVQGPRVRWDSAARPRGSIGWRDHTQFLAGVPTVGDTAQAWLRFQGRLDDPNVKVDTTSYHVSGRRAGPPPDPAGVVRPDHIPGLPAWVRNELDRAGCRIPLVPDSPTDVSGSNVVSGSFGVRGQTDWAVRCWRDHQSATVVVWGGRAACPGVVGNWARDSMVTDVPRSPEDVTLLAVADSTRIANIEVYGPPDDDPTWTPLSEWRGYEGIEVISEKGSSVWYCANGKWIRLGGAD